MSDPKENQTRRERIRRFIQSRNTSYSSSRFDTSDVIQETELQLWRTGVDRLDSEYSEIDQALLGTIARGHLAKKLRDNSRVKRNAAVETQFNDTIHSKNTCPVKAAEVQELSDIISEIVGRMEELDQRIYFLRFHCAESFSAIEREVGLTRRQLETRLANLKKHIRKNLESKRYGKN